MELSYNLYFLSKFHYSSRDVKADIAKYRDVAPHNMTDNALAQLIAKYNSDHTAISSALQDLWQGKHKEMWNYLLIMDCRKCL